MYRVLTGKQRSLVFPVMCNARVKMGYAANIPDIEGTPSDTTDDTGYGIWSHEGGFTFEAIITPYDVNGYGHADAPSYSSKKIMPANGHQATPSDYESELYLSSTARLTHEMMLFYNTNFQFSLVNATQNNVNQPAEYKLRVRLKLGSTTDTYTTNTVILSENEREFVYSDLLATFLGPNLEGKLAYNFLSSATLSGTTLTPTSSITRYGIGHNVFYHDNTDWVSLGSITANNGTTVTITNPNSVTLGSSTRIFSDGYREPIYINRSFHVACVFEELGNTLKIYLDGRLLSTDTHSDTGAFSFDRTDIFLASNGSDSTGAGSATTNKQFMGELHELSITNTRRVKFPYINNLMPNYDNTLLYLRFEEVDA